MGKIRVKTLGDESLEEEQKKQAKKRKEAKKVTKAPGMKGGERVVAVGPSEEELKHVIAIPSLSREKQSQKIATSPTAPRDDKKMKKAGPKRVRSKKYQSVALMVDKKKQYSLAEALELLPKLKLSRFDETVELHINTTEAGLTADLTLPHGSGKQIRVAIVDPSTSSGQGEIDELIRNIEKGSIDFDVLIATPSAMPKLARVAKYLGPKGLMPNPKNGTITEKPKEAAKAYLGGKMRVKTEAKIPIIHLAVGKLSFGGEKLTDNITTVFSALPKVKITKATIKSTMSPGIRLDFSTIS